MMLETIWQDLRHGARLLAHNPSLTAIAILSIALGVGTNAAMFSIADGMALRPLQVPRASEVVAVTPTSTRTDATGPLRGRTVSYRDYVDLRDGAQSFDGLLAYRVLITSFTPRPDQPAQSRLGLAVSGNFFDVLGLTPQSGRTFLAGEDQVPGRDAVVVLAHGTWVEQFGADPGVAGRHLQIGGVDFTIVGVAPAGFTGMDLVLHPAFYVPLAMLPSVAGGQPDALERRDARTLTIKGRLTPGVSIEQAQQDATRIASALERTYPATNAGIGLLVRTDFDSRMEERGPAAPASLLLIALALVVLLVACANVAGLLLSRAPVREREIMLRLAIGGSRLRIGRQLITESVLIAAGGGALGLAFGYAAIRWFGGFQTISDIGVQSSFRVDGRVLAVGLVLTAVSALASSLVPAWRATRNADLTSGMKATAESSARHARLWGRNGLVAGQIALSLVMLTIAVFFYRTFEGEFSRPGFRTERLLLVNLQPALARFDDQRSEMFHRLLEERVRGLAGVTSVGLTTVMPMNQDYRERSSVVPEGYQLPPGTDSVSISSTRIDEGYLATMAIPVISGRGLLATDTASSPFVAVINQTMASRYWPGESAVGKIIRLRDRGDVRVQIVGVAANTKYAWLGEAPTPFLYLPHRQHPIPRSTVVIASSGNAAALAGPVRDIVRELDAEMPIASLRTMEEFYYGSAFSTLSGFVAVVGGMGILGVALAMIGLFGLVSYAAVRRTREIGIRMAIGARPYAVLRMVLRHGLFLALAGVAIGIVATAATGGLLRGLVPTSQGIGVTTYLLVVPALLGITLLAAYIPARRAARINPIVALRMD